MSQIAIYSDLICRDQSQAGISSFEASVEAMKTRLESEDIEIGLVPMDGITPQFQQIQAQIESTGIEVNLDPEDNVTDALDRIRAEAAANPVVVPVENENEDDEDDDDDDEPGAGGGGGRGFGTIIAAMLARRLIQASIKNFELDSKLGSEEDADDPLKESKDKLKEVNEKLSGFSGFILGLQDAFEKNIGVLPEAQELPELQQQQATYQKTIADAEAKNKAISEETSAQSRREKESSALQGQLDGATNPDQSALAKRKRDILEKLAREEAELDAMARAGPQGDVAGYQTKAGGSFASQDAQTKYIDDTRAKDRALAQAQIDIETAKETAEQKKKIAEEVARYTEEANRASLAVQKSDLTSELDAFDAAWKQKLATITDADVKKAAIADRDAQRFKMVQEGQRKVNDLEEEAKENAADAAHKPKEAEFDKESYEIQQRIHDAGEDTARRKAETDLGIAELQKLKASLTPQAKGGVTSLDSYEKTTLDGNAGLEVGLSKQIQAMIDNLEHNKPKAGSSPTADASAGADAFAPAAKTFNDSMTQYWVPTVQQMYQMFVTNPVEIAIITT